MQGRVGLWSGRAYWAVHLSRSTSTSIHISCIECRGSLHARAVPLEFSPTWPRPARTASSV
eukprot:3003527-Rhodomonas_salina.4